MEVRDIMRTEVETCGPEMTIETVASMMKGKALAEELGGKCNIH